jgi:hypothetical protein
MQPILGHFWLLLRVMIFAYFILGTNMGWRRPLALAFIGLGFWTKDPDNSRERKAKVRQASRDLANCRRLKNWRSD